MKLKNFKIALTIFYFSITFFWEAYCSATRCHICEKLFVQDTRVRDHCHLTGRYYGPAHSNCNLNYKNLYILIVIHNLSSYDARFIIKEITTAYDRQVDLLPITKEKYISLLNMLIPKIKIKITFRKII